MCCTWFLVDLVHVGGNWFCKFKSDRPTILRGTTFSFLGETFESDEVNRTQTL